MNSTPNSSELRSLRICQQNLRKSPTAHSAFTSSVGKYDIVCLQEPYIDHLGNSRSPLGWTPVYPTHHHDFSQRTRAITFISPNIRSDCWSQLDLANPDITAIQISSAAGELVLINVYNDQTHNRSLEQLHSFILSLGERQTFDSENTQILLLGDLNRHHPTVILSPT